jgi:xanthine dehydrogenase accessory factor
VPYVGLVASGKRGAGVLEELRADGVPEEQLERIDVPAGIPIGSRTPAEIALSIVAKIVAVRRGEAAVAQSPAATAIDPICGMTVATVAGTPSIQHGDETIYFCCEACRAKFETQDEHAIAGG